MFVKIMSPSFQFIMILFWTGNVYADEIDLPINPKPTFIVELKNITLEAGNYGIFICETNSDLDNIEWYRTKVSDDNINSDEVFEAKIDKSSGLNIHVFRNVKHEDEGWYSCVAWKKNLEINFSTAYLKIVDKLSNDEKERIKNEGHRPYFMNKIDLQPTIERSLGQLLDLKCDAVGNPEPNITWYKNGINFTQRSFQAEIEWNKNSIVLPGFTKDDIGNYTCILCNHFRCINHTFIVQYNGQIHAPPIFTKKLENLTLEVGTTGSFTCETISSNDHIEWFQNKVSKENVNSDEFLGTIINGNEGRNTYELENVKYENEGWYSCVVRNIHDSEPGFSTAYLKVVDELPTAEKEKIKTILSAAAILVVVILAAVIVVIFIYNKSKRKEQDLEMRAMRATALTHCIIKKIIIEKSVDSGCCFDGPMRAPTVKIESYSDETVRDRLNSFSTIEYELPPDEEWEFPRRDLQLGEILGQGEFGKVVKAVAAGILQFGIQTTVAVKMLKDDHRDADMQALVSEMEIMKMIGTHENIVNLLGCCSQGGPLFVITEFAAHGNLRDYLRGYVKTTGLESNYADGRIDEKTLIGFIHQIAKGMEYLAMKRCIHRDLAARNILVADNYTMKIADFGLARDVHETDYYRKTSDSKLPIKWMAPESLFHRIYSAQSDVWSFGVLMWEIVTMGGVPYPTMDNMNSLFEFLRYGNRMDKPPDCSTELYRIMRDCWSYQPNERPVFSVIVEELDKLLTDEKKLTSPGFSVSHQSSFFSEYSESDTEIDQYFFYLKKLQVSFKHGLVSSIIELDETKKSKSSKDAYSSLATGCQI